MPNPPTPGQICYEAYWQGVPLRWTEEPASEQAQWEAAAQAVLAHVPGYTVEYDENGCAWLIEQATRLRMALSHGTALRIAQITLPAYHQEEHPDA
jgi:hypothetical protein